MLKAWGSIGSCIHFKVYKWLLDAAQPQLTTTTFFSSCMKLDYFVVGNFRIYKESSNMVAKKFFENLSSGTIATAEYT